LVYGQSDSGGFTCGDGFDGFGVIHAERFLSEDSFYSFAAACGFDEIELRIRRNGDVEHFDFTIIPDWALHWVHSVWNLYRYSGDSAEGQASGEGSGGIWFVVEP